MGVMPSVTSTSINHAQVQVTMPKDSPPPSATDCRPGLDGQSKAECGTRDSDLKSDSSDRVSPVPKQGVVSQAVISLLTDCWSCAVFSKTADMYSGPQTA